MFDHIPICISTRPPYIITLHFPCTQALANRREDSANIVIYLRHKTHTSEKCSYISLANSPFLPRLDVSYIYAVKSCRARRELSSVDRPNDSRPYFTAPGPVPRRAIFRRLRGLIMMPAEISARDATLDLC